MSKEVSNSRGLQALAIAATVVLGSEACVQKSTTRDKPIYENTAQTSQAVVEAMESGTEIDVGLTGKMEVTGIEHVGANITLEIMSDHPAAGKFKTYEVSTNDNWNTHTVPKIINGTASVDHVYSFSLCDDGNAYLVREQNFTTQLTRGAWNPVTRTVGTLSDVGGGINNSGSVEHFYCEGAKGFATSDVLGGRYKVLWAALAGGNYVELTTCNVPGKDMYHFSVDTVKNNGFIIYNTPATADGKLYGYSDKWDGSNCTTPTPTPTDMNILAGVTSYNSGVVGTLTTSMVPDKTNGDTYHTTRTGATSKLLRTKPKSVTPPPDAGIDSGKPDTGAPDTGTADTGVKPDAAGEDGGGTTTLDNCKPVSVTSGDYKVLAPCADGKITVVGKGAGVLKFQPNPSKPATTMTCSTVNPAEMAMDIERKGDAADPTWFATSVGVQGIHCKVEESSFDNKIHVAYLFPDVGKGALAGPEDTQYSGYITPDLDTDGDGKPDANLTSQPLTSANAVLTLESIEGRIDYTDPQGHELNFVSPSGKKSHLDTGEKVNLRVATMEQIGKQEAGKAPEEPTGFLGCKNCNHAGHIPDLQNSAGDALAIVLAGVLATRRRKQDSSSQPKTR